MSTQEACGKPTLIERVVNLCPGPYVLKCLVFFTVFGMEQKVSKISEWPFDTATLSWFSAIVIMVLGTIITRYLVVFIGL